MTLKATYALDAASVRALEQLARRWQVSKSAALRRAIGVAAGQAPPRAVEALNALDRLQRDLDLSPARARAWAERASDQRRAGSPRPAGRRR